MGSAERTSLTHVIGDRAFDRTAPIPFEDLLLPFVRDARARLAEHTCVAPALSDAAQVQLERALLRRLSSAAAPSLYHEFEQRAGYRAFVDELLNDDRQSFDRRYAELAPFLAMRAVAWVDGTRELAERIVNDSDTLSATFGDGEPLGPARAVTTDLSDPHNGGRTVAIVEFANGTRAVYKPRSLGTDVAFADFIGWMNGAGATPPLRALRVIDRGSYGWMEYAVAGPCENQRATRDFYRRAGMLAATAYLVGAQDLHGGNVLACGAHPVLFDLEALMQPKLSGEGFGDPAVVGSWRQVHGSVLSTNLLPSLSRTAVGGSYTEGGFARMDVRATVIRHWLDVNTDDMALYETPAESTEGVNVPAHNSGSLSDDEQLAEILAGFRHIYAIARNQRGILGHDDGPLARFRGLRMRLIFRSTDIYGKVLRRSLRPQTLANRAGRRAELEVLRRPFVRAQPRHRLWAALDEEIRQLERGDVPVFHIDTDGTSLHAGDRVIVPDYAEASGYAEMRARLSRLGAADATRQTELARVAWTMHSRRRAQPSGRTSAIDIVDTLRRVSRRSRRGGIEWMNLNDRGFQSTDDSFANGNSGIAFFLAAARLVTGSDTRELVLGAIEPLLRASRSPAALRRIVRSHGIGAARGVGGIVYALTRIGRWLDNDELLGAATRLATTISERRVARDRALDVFDGAAGGMLGLLALHDATGSADALERAVVCGRHLLSHRAIDESANRRVWRTMDGELTGGFAHGAAGIAAALGRLRAYSADPAIDRAIADTRAFEATMFIPEQHNWASTQRTRDAAAQGQPRICGWCHGAAGIGLGRLSLLSPEEDPALLAEIEASLDAMRAFEATPAAQDHLCCGNVGRIDLLRVAASRLDRPDLADRARAYAAKVCTQAARRQTFGVGHVDEGFAPTLFFGLAGVGYELLRVDHADRLPSALIWE